MPHTFQDKGDSRYALRPNHMRRNGQMTAQTITQQEIEELNVLVEGLPNRIKLAMEDAGQSVGEIARMMEVRDRTVADWRSTGMISKERLPLLAKLLGVSVEWLLTGKESTSVQIDTSDNIVSIGRRLTQSSNIHPPSQTLVYSPVLEIDELFSLTAEVGEQGHALIENKLEEFCEDPNSRPVIPVMTADHNDPGIPRFHFQNLVDGYAPAYMLGDFIGISTGIYPWIGRFVMIALKSRRQREGESGWQLGSGFYYPVGQQPTSDGNALGFPQIDQFVLKRDESPHLTRPDDIHVDCQKDEWAYIGVATHLYRWQHRELLFNHTKISERNTASYETYKIRD